MGIRLKKEKNSLNLNYSPQNGITWIEGKFSHNEVLVIYKVFNVTKNELVLQSDSGMSFVEFKIANIEQMEGGKFYHIDKNVLLISFDLYISEECWITDKWFVGKRRTSIFKIIDSFWGQDKLFIGGNSHFSVSENEFTEIIRSLPNDTEMNNYVKARICSAMKNILPVKKDVVSQFQRYLNKKMLAVQDMKELDFEEFDMYRYEILYKELKKMLAEQESYSEACWQKIIMKFIKILFPKYVFIEQHPQISISEKQKKIPDIILGDVDGYVDIIEIKKPFFNGMITAKKSNLYRNNYIPLRELSGAIMQCEKYIYFMTTCGKEAEKTLNKQFESVLPSNYSLKIVNPKAMIIMGRSNEFEEQQREDFEIIKRKYKNIIDIITYDDLLHRLERAKTILKS